MLCYPLALGYAQLKSFLCCSLMPSLISSSHEWNWSIVELLAAGWTQQEILDNYPHISQEDIRACLAYAAEVLHSEHIVPGRLYGCRGTSAPWPKSHRIRTAPCSRLTRTSETWPSVGAAGILQPNAVSYGLVDYHGVCCAGDCCSTVGCHLGRPLLRNQRPPDPRHSVANSPQRQVTTCLRCGLAK